MISGMTVLFLLTVLTLCWIMDIILSIFGTTDLKDQVSGMRFLSVFEQVVIAIYEWYSWKKHRRSRKL